MADEGLSDEEEHLDLFKEPEGYYGPEKQHTFVAYTTHMGETLNLRLVGHNPLWVGASAFLRFLRCTYYPILR
jgi:hypothetical protein